MLRVINFQYHTLTTDIKDQIHLKKTYIYDGTVYRDKTEFYNPDKAHKTYPPISKTCLDYVEC